MDQGEIGVSTCFVASVLVERGVGAEEIILRSSSLVSFACSSA